MTEQEAEVLPEDDQPSSGVWVDTDEVIHNPTDEEVAEGQRLGEAIDTDDDEDDGYGQG